MNATNMQGAPKKYHGDPAKRPRTGERLTPRPEALATAHPSTETARKIVYASRPRERKEEAVPLRAHSIAGRQASTRYRRRRKAAAVILTKPGSWFSVRSVIHGWSNDTWTKKRAA